MSSALRAAFSSSRTLPGQGWCSERTHRLGMDGRLLIPSSVPYAGEEVSHRIGDILGPFAKRRNLDNARR